MAKEKWTLVVNAVITSRTHDEAVHASAYAAALATMMKSEEQGTMTVETIYETETQGAVREVISRTCTFLPPQVKAKQVQP